jgi:hypothetical protein
LITFVEVEDEAVLEDQVDQPQQKQQEKSQEKPQRGKKQQDQ